MHKTWFLYVMIGLFMMSPIVSAQEEILEISVTDENARVSYQAIDERRLLVSVEDADGNAIQGLTLEDFTVSKGTKQARLLAVETLEANEEVGLNVVLVVDNSTSMKRRKAIEPLITAVEGFFDIIRPIDNVHVVVFNPKGSQAFDGKRLHTQSLESNDPMALKAFLKNSFKDGLSGGTYLYEGIMAGFGAMRTMPEESTKLMVVFSDGEDINSDFERDVVEKTAAELKNLQIYTIDYMPSASLDPFLESMATQHQGRTWKASSADELIPIFQSFSTTLLRRYVVAYRFLDPPQGSVSMEPLELTFNMLSYLDGALISNVIFFDEGFSDIPDRYQRFETPQHTTNFNRQNLASSLERHLNTLNIVGNRLKQDPDLTATVVGFSYGTDTALENKALAEQRADQIKNYLQTIWEIDSSRLHTEGRDASETETTDASARKPGYAAQFRRAEIIYAKEDVEAQARGDYIGEANNMNTLRIEPRIKAEYGVAEWQLQIWGDDHVLWNQTGQTAPPAVLEIPMDELGRQNMAKFGSLNARMTVTDTNQDRVEIITEPCPVTILKNNLIHQLLGPPKGSIAVAPPELTIEEITIIDTSPMLNYVYFDTGKSDIPSRYVLYRNQTDTQNFAISDLKGTMEKYQHVLNIIGKRLVQYPEALIKIIGCNSNRGTEKGRIDLSRSRAEAVRSYLLYMWGIDSSRMEIVTRNQPPVPSTSKIAEGRAENQRVEIHTDFPTILVPIKSTYIEEKSSTPVITITPHIKADYGIKSWKLNLTAAEKILASMDGQGALETEYAFDLATIGLRSIASHPQLTARVEVIDQKDQVWQQNGQPPIPVSFIQRQEKLASRSGYKVLEKYALILFEYNRATIKDENLAVLEQIHERIKQFPDAIVTITGHTDNIGGDAYNLDLSQRRAKAVHNKIRAFGISPDVNVSHEGAGPNDPLYDNTLPEGRALNRTVTVSVEYEKQE